MIQQGNPLLIVMASLYHLVVLKEIRDNYNYAKKVRSGSSSYRGNLLVVGGLEVGVCVCRVSNFVHRYSMSELEFPKTSNSQTLVTDTFVRIGSQLRSGSGEG